jgi:transposase
MTRPLSIELREKIVNAYKKGLGSTSEIAEIFSVTQRTVFRFLKLEREKGDLSPTPIPGRPPILNEKNLAIIKKIVLTNTDETLDQYRLKFYEETGIDVSAVTIHNACNILDLRRKKKVSLQRNKNGRTSK